MPAVGEPSLIFCYKRPGKSQITKSELLSPNYQVPQNIPTSFTISEFSGGAS